MEHGDFSGAKYLQSLFSDWNVVIQLAAYLLSLTCAIFTIGVDWVFQSRVAHMMRIARIYFLFISHVSMYFWDAYFDMFLSLIEAIVGKISQGRLNRNVCLGAIFSVLWNYHWKKRHCRKPKLNKLASLRLTRAGFISMLAFFFTCIINATYEFFIGAKTPFLVSSVFGYLAVAALLAYPGLFGGGFVPLNSRLRLQFFCFFVLISIPPTLYGIVLYQEFIDFLDALLSLCGLPNVFRQFFFLPLLTVFSIKGVLLAGSWELDISEAIAAWELHLSQMASAG